MNNSRKTLITLLMLLFMGTAFAQTKPAVTKTAASGDCFKEWYTLFRSRGAKQVTDGTQEVIITIRGQNSNQCYLGKIEVANGKIKLPLWVQKDDGSFETFGSSGKKLDPEFASSTSEDDLLAITDGMSISFRTTDQEYGRLFFYKFVNDKPKANKVAPSPSALIKN